MSGLYKGFIATDGKQPMEKYKGLNDFKCYKDVQKLPSFAGVLRDDCIMIDVDDDHWKRLKLKAGDRVKVWGEVDTHRNKPTDIEVIQIEHLK